MVEICCHQHCIEKPACQQNRRFLPPEPPLLRHCYTSLTTLTLLCHLCNLYTHLTPVKLASNDEAVKASFDANLPYENFVEQIKEAVLIGDTAGTPYSTRQILTTAYNVLQRTGVFKDECKAW